MPKELELFGATSDAPFSLSGLLINLTIGVLLALLVRWHFLRFSLVVEIKFSRPDRHQAAELLENIPIRIGRHSKYMNAVRSISMA